ncbi:26144_t:CDS:2 [Gigaspora rosea]|nr:26144_t:CDS:2 [Gigaspora rosea]
MQPDIALYTPKYRRMSSEILKKVEFYIMKKKIGSKQMFSLLSAKFPEYTIHKRDLYNSVQKFRKPLNQYYVGIQSTQRVEVMNRLIKDGIRSTSLLYNLYENIQKLLDNKAQWAR